MTITANQIKHAFLVSTAVAEAVRMAGPAGLPSGPLYAMLMAKTGMDLESYDRMLATLERARLVERTAGGELLKWVGPDLPAGPVKGGAV